jgi:hypothetical protein
MSGVSGTYARSPQTAGSAGNESARYPMDELEATEFLVDKLRGTKNNADFFDSMRRG